MKACLEFTLKDSKNNAHLMTPVAVAWIIKAQVEKHYVEIQIP